MELSLDFDFRYPEDPRIAITVRSPVTRLDTTTYAFVDTGAQRSLLDSRILRDVEHREVPLRRSTLTGVGGGEVSIEVYQVGITLLGQPALTVELPIAFGNDVEPTFGNLIGLDVLEHFDFALAHADRLGYLGRR